MADVNQDGLADIITLNLTSADIVVLLGNGDGTVLAEENRFDAGNAPTGLAVHDVNGDGLPDLVVANEFGDVMTLIHNDLARIAQGAGLFASLRRTDREVALAVGDINGDGASDWVVTNESDDSLSIEFGHNPSCGSPDRNIVRIGTRDDGVVAPADAKTAQLNDDNGDGRVDERDLLDLVVANSGANNVLVYMGLGMGTGIGDRCPATNGATIGANSPRAPFAAAQTYFAGTEPVDVAISDVNADEQMDIVVTNQGSNDITILLGEGKGPDPFFFRQGVRLDVFNPAAPDLAAGPRSTVVGDFVGVEDDTPDGIPDLLVAGSQADAAVLLAGLGGGFFNDTSPAIFETGNDPVEIVPLPGFGFATINSGSNDVSLFRGFGSTFSVDRVATGARPMSTLQFDFNADSFLDLLVGNNGDGTISILAGGPNGLSLIDTFLSAEIQHPTALALAESSANDFSLLVADEGDELVSVFNRADLLGDDPAVMPESFLTQIAGAPVGSTLLTAVTTVLFAGLADLNELEPADFGNGSGSDPLVTIAALVQAVNSIVDVAWSVVDAVIGSFNNIVGTEMTAEWSLATLEEVIDMVLPLPYLEMLGSLPGVVQQIVDSGGANPGASSVGQAADESAAGEVQVEASQDGQGQPSVSPVATEATESTVSMESTEEDTRTLAFDQLMKEAIQPATHSAVHSVDYNATADAAAPTPPTKMTERRTSTIDYLAALGALCALAAASSKVISRRLPGSLDFEIGADHAGNE